jgi:hypothetical protein
MRAILNQTVQIAGFAKPVPTGAVVTVVDETEANQLFARGYMTKTTKEATHDHLSISAEAEAAAEAAAQVEVQKKAIREADADKPAVIDTKFTKAPQKA